MALEDPDTNPNDKVIGSWLNTIDAKMLFLPAHNITMSCGTVTLDLARAKVLIVWNKRYQIYQLPKGRRNIEETMLSAAVRETYEETGYRVKPLQLNIATRATPAVREPGQGNPLVTDGFVSTEYLGGCLHEDPDAAGSTKTTFFYAATADSTAVPETDTQEEWEKLVPSWIDISDAATTLRFKGEVAAVMKAVEDARKTGLTIGV
ncbi:hypothetical protein B0T17DRAFT_488116 [Bombardia bombarda]|uniref:Nudix hydrolase domain-containing protein n=1 Tax=Bombardia bombarda TaxID=252184 RepID=A0AA40C817_9PEZI|nr:hypothetical protein B0T17DRAFT_488116 [Bombardia bombarda]